MYKIIRKKELNENTVMMDIYAPLVADKAKAGQFVILRVDENGERIPLTVAGTDKKEKSVKVIFQKVGATTFKLSQKNEGEYIETFAGPLGNPTKTDGMKKVCIVGGGVGCAIALPVARAFKENKTEVISVIGFRSSDLIILKDEFSQCSDKTVIMTDDGSAGEKGNVCIPLERMLKDGEKFDEIIAIGPLVMMKYVVLTAKKYNIPCIVSMNPIMIDGTGMCGGCRLTLNRDGRKITEFACVDGPEFNGYEVDFDEAIKRNSYYRDFERKSYEKECNLFKGVKE